LAIPLVLVEREKEILRVSPNRTSALNAINSDLPQDLEQGLKRFELDPALRLVVLSGQGGGFASGADTAPKLP